jgi:hypothetical protein
MIHQDWRDKISQEATNIIRKIDGTKLYGWPVNVDDRDAMIVAAFYLGQKEEQDWQAARIARRSS